MLQKIGKILICVLLVIILISVVFVCLWKEQKIKYTQVKAWAMCVDCVHVTTSRHFSFFLLVKHLYRMHSVITHQIFENESCSGVYLSFTETIWTCQSNPNPKWNTWDIHIRFHFWWRVASAHASLVHNWAQIRSAKVFNVSDQCV